MILLDSDSRDGLTNVLDAMCRLTIRSMAGGMLLRRMSALSLDISNAQKIQI